MQKDGIRYLSIKISSVFATIFSFILNIIFFFKASNSVRIIFIYILLFSCCLFGSSAVIASKKCKKIEKDIKEMEKENE